MLIAIPVIQDRLSSHFGRSTGLVLFHVDPSDRRIIEQRHLSVEADHRCHGLPQRLKKLGVDLVIAGGIGQGAAQRLAELEIQFLCTHRQQPPQQLVQDYLLGQLPADTITCQGTGHHHGQTHRHQHGRRCAGASNSHTPPHRAR